MPSPPPPALFDLRLAAMRRARAEKSPRPGADFLIARAAEDLADRLGVTKRRFTRALDIATPTGHAATALAATGKIDGIVRVGAALGVDEDFALAPAGADLAVSLLALHQTNDLPGILAQIRRALKPGGLFLAAMIGGETLTQLRQAFLRADSEISGGAPPRVAPFADVKTMGALLQRAGFRLPVVDLDRVTARYDTLFALMADLRAMGATNVLSERSRKPLRRAALLRAAQTYAETFADSDGRLRATFDIVWLSGWAPDG